VQTIKYRWPIDLSFEELLGNIMAIEFSKLNGGEKFWFVMSIIAVILGSIGALGGLSGFGLDSYVNGSVALGLAIAMGGFTLFVTLFNSINMRDIKEQLNRIEMQTKPPD
jgi:hypothetical protein